jgi:hypothetical protein
MAHQPARRFGSPQRGDGGVLACRRGGWCLAGTAAAAGRLKSSATGQPSNADMVTVIMSTEQYFPDGSPEEKCRIRTCELGWLVIHSYYACVPRWWMTRGKETLEKKVENPPQRT